MRMTSGAVASRGRIRATLGCDEEMAEGIRERLAAVMRDHPTRAFVSRACHLTTTTVPAPPAKGRAPAGDRATYINEGKRMFALFLVQCAEAGLELDLFTDMGDKK